MAVDLADLIPSLQAEINPPGTDLYPNATDTELVQRMSNAFWEAKLFGFNASFTESEGTVLPITGSTDMDRQSQQLLVLFAAIAIVRMQLMNTNTLFKAVAGPVSLETQNSANLLNEILKELQSKIHIIYYQIGNIGKTQVAYIDSLVERQLSIGYGDTPYSGSDSYGRYGASPYGAAGSSGYGY